LTNYFALLDGDVRIQRIPVSRDVQEQLASWFADAALGLCRPDFERVPFSGTYKAERGEVLYVDAYELPEDVTAAIANPAGVPLLNLGVPNPPQVRAVWAAHVAASGPVLTAQAINRHQVLSNQGWSLIHAKGTYRRLDEPGLTLRGTADLHLEAGRLHFMSYSYARRIFPMSEHYREATDGDLLSFATHSALQVSAQEDFMSGADQWTRRKVALILDKGVLNMHTAESIQQQALRYGLPLEVAGSKLMIPSDKKLLKRMLRFLDEDYFTGPLTLGPYVTNSKRPA